MSKLKKVINVIEYISKPMNEDDVLLLYRVNNIQPERVNLYLDFMYGLHNTITSTYLGDDVVLTKDDKKGHFNWCWEKVIKSFEKEKIYFKTNKEIYNYFFTLFDESFYKEDDKSNNNVNNLLNFINNGFKYSPKKTKSELDYLIELYKIFEKSLSKTL